MQTKLRYLHKLTHLLHTKSPPFQHVGHLILLKKVTYFYLPITTSGPRNKRARPSEGLSVQQGAHRHQGTSYESHGGHGGMSAFYLRAVSDQDTKQEEPNQFFLAVTRSNSTCWISNWHTSLPYGESPSQRLDFRACTEHWPSGETNNQRLTMLGNFWKHRLSSAYL